MPIEGTPIIDYAALKNNNSSMIEDGVVNADKQKKLLVEIQTQIQQQKDALQQGADAAIHEKLLKLIFLMLGENKIGTDDWTFFLNTLQASMAGLSGVEEAFAGALLDAFNTAENEYKGEMEPVLEETSIVLGAEEIAVSVDSFAGVSDYQKKDIKRYFSDVLGKGNKDIRKQLLGMLRDIKYINAPSFFAIIFNISEKPADWTKVGYVPQGKRLHRWERRLLDSLTATWLAANGTNGNAQIKAGFQYLASVYGSADFTEKGKEKEGGKLMGYINKAKTVWEEAKTTEKGAELLQHLIGDTDLDGELEALSQGPTNTRRARRQLEKAQKQEGRGVVSEEGLGALFAKAKKKIESDGKATEALRVDDILAQNIVSYMTSQPRFAYLQPEFTNINTISAFMNMLFAHPEVIGALRDYARLVPDDFVKVLEGGDVYVGERAATQTESAEKIEADRALVETYLNSSQGAQETVELIKALDQKFRGISISLEGEKDKIKKQLEAANTGVEEMDDERRQQLVIQYTALNTAQAALADPATAKRAMLDLVHVGGLVSVIPNAQGVGAAATFRFYEAEAKSLVQSIDMQVGGFQGIGGPGATGVGLNIVAGGTIQQSRKNTLFYTLNGGTGMQLVQGIRGFGWNAGLTFGNEFWINEGKMKKLTPTNKVMIGALVSGGVSGDFTKATPGFKPWSAQAGLYLRRDKLAGLEAQQGEIYVTVMEILSQVKNGTEISVQALHEKITAYCKRQNIKQTPEEIDRVARVLHSILTPYASAVGKHAGSTQPAWMSEVAEQIARNRFNSSTDDASAFAITGVGLGVGFNFLGIYPSVGLQAQIRKSSVYAPDKDSQVRSQAAFEQATYDEKFTGSFAQNIDKINTRFGLTEEANKLTKVTRPVGSVPAYDFVHFPLSTLTSTDPRVELFIAPGLINDDDSFRFQKSVDGLGLDLPGTMAVSIVQEVRDGSTINKIVVGDTMGKNAIAIDPNDIDSKTFATDDTWIADFQAKTESIFFDEKIAKVQEQLFDFLAGQVKAGWKLPYDLTNKSSIIVKHNNGTITGYNIKIKSGTSFHGTLPAGVTRLGEYLVVPPQIQLNVLYSTAPSDAAAPRYLTAEQNTTGLSFGYTVETTGFSQAINNDVNIDLLQSVDERLRNFISSTEGAEMLMKWRYDTSPVERDKEEYYKLMRQALKDGNYQPVFDFAKTYIDASGSQEAQQVFTDMENGGITKDNRANLYLIYGALSRVRMTEYKHLQVSAEKLDIFDAQIAQLGRKISPENATYLRECLKKGNCDPERTADILRSADARFTGWGDTKYYYDVFKDRKDPMYRLIFLFAPVAKVFETRTSATDRRLKEEFRGDPQSTAALNRAYAIVQESLNTKLEQLFAEQKILANDVGLIFGYGPKEMDEKFVFYPKSTGERIDLLNSGLSTNEQQRVKTYYLDEYYENNPFDVQAEVDAMVIGIHKQFDASGVDMTAQEIKNKQDELTNALLPNGQVKEDVYKKLMLTGKIPSLDWFNTGDSKSLLTFSMDWGIAAYSECVNFMIVKGDPKIQMKLKKKYTLPTFTPQPVDLQMVSHPGQVVAEQVVIQKQANRRVQSISLGLMGGVYKDPETGESTTLPVDISEEDFNNIQLDPTPSSMIISTTGEQVNAFAGSFGNKSGMFYIDSATGNRKFFEGSVAGGPNNTLIFTPATQATNVNVGDVLYTGRHLGQMGQSAIGAVMQAKLKQLPYDAYEKQMIDLRKSEIDYIKDKRKN